MCTNPESRTPKPQKPQKKDPKKRCSLFSFFKILKKTCKKKFLLKYCVIQWEKTKFLTMASYGAKNGLFSKNGRLAPTPKNPYFSEIFEKMKKTSIAFWGPKWAKMGEKCKNG